jgi:hypothetical protein
MYWLDCYLSWAPSCELITLNDILGLAGLCFISFIVIGFLDTLENGEEGWFYKLFMPKVDE